MPPSKAPTIPRSKWAIKVPKRVKGVYSRQGDSHCSYEEVCQSLEGMGFEKVSETVGVRHDSVARANVREDAFSIWIHPAGLWVEMDSYGPPQRKEEMQGRQINSLALCAEYSTGSSWDSYRLAHELLNGSGGTYPTLDGCNVFDRSFSCGSNSRSSLFTVLENMQSVARIVPFEKWSKDHSLYIDKEQILGITPTDEDVGLTGKEMVARRSDEFNSNLAVLLKKVPPSLAEKIEDAFLPVNERAMREHISSRTWARVEDTINYYTKTLDAGGIQWPNEAQSAQLSNWSLRLNEYGAPLDASLDRWDQPGPAGINFASALLMTWEREGNSTRLLDLLRQVDIELLTHWITQPDARGCHFLMHALEHASNPSHWAGATPLSRTPEMDMMEKILDVLSERVDLSTLSVFTDTHSPVGMLHKLIAGDKVEERAAHRLMQVLELVRERGIAWYDATSEQQAKLLEEIKAAEKEKGLNFAGSVKAFFEADQLTAGVAQVSPQGAARPRF